MTVKKQISASVSPRLPLMSCPVSEGVLLDTVGVAGEC